MTPTEQAEQEPVAWKDLTYGNLHHQDFGNSIPLYAAPVRTKELTHERERLAIREAAFEEAARWCDAYIDRLHELRDNDESLPMYQPELAGRQAGAARCAAGIRGLK